MFNKQLLTYLFKDYTPKLGDNLVDVVLYELYMQYKKYFRAMVILKRYGIYCDIFSFPSDKLSKHKQDLFYMVYPPKYLENEVQSDIFKLVIPIIIDNFIAYINHNPLNKTQVTSLHAWIHQLHSLGLSGTANLLDRVYVHHSLSL